MSTKYMLNTNKDHPKSTRRDLYVHNWRKHKGV